MGNIEKFFWEALFINHVNFSGMNLNEDQVSKLLEIFKGCQFLLGFHLSDNNIIRSCSGSGNEYFKGNEVCENDANQVEFMLDERT